MTDFLNGVAQLGSSTQPARQTTDQEQNSESMIVAELEKLELLQMINF